MRGFRSKKGRRFNAGLKLSPEFKVEFDFGNGEQRADGGGTAAVDFTGKEPLGKCPRCGARVFEAGMSYVCEKAVGRDRTCTFRTGKIILQQNVEPEQVKKLLAGGKTDLLTNFVSKRNGRAFKAFLVVGKDGEIGFEFPPREGRTKSGAARKPKEPALKTDFSGREPVGKCPKCGGKVFATDRAYVCEKSQADKKPCKFKINREILQQPIERAQAQKLLTARRTDLLDQFISKAGRPFPACLVMDDAGKVTFEFPPHKEEKEAAR